MNHIVKPRDKIIGESTSEPQACSSLGTQTKQVMQPVKSVNYASVVKGNIRDVPDGRQSRGAQNSVVPVPTPRRFIAGAPQIDRTRVQNEFCTRGKGVAVVNSLYGRSAVKP